ncbi:MAG: hypothetical protein EBY68_05555 [Actinobacteria bacterium]|nr:hypothetical protein [Actinomycetota bacterium]
MNSHGVSSLKARAVKAARTANETVPSTSSGPFAAVVSELSSTTGWCACAGETKLSDIAAAIAMSAIRFIDKKYKEHSVCAVRICKQMGFDRNFTGSKTLSEMN